MGKAQIYYFSGTGNTLYLAKELAALLDAKLVPIASTTAEEKIYTSAEIIGIVYPVYYGELPPMVHEFVKKLKGMADKYIFAVSNFGGGSGFSMKTLERHIHKAGGTLAAAYGVHMPQNAFRKFWENDHRMIKRGGRKCRRIARHVLHGKSGIRMRGPIQYMTYAMHERFLPLYKKGLAKRSGLSSDLAMDVLARAADRTFAANENCTACGICEKVCPAGNIVIENGRPKWQGTCENCLACYNWCPTRAIFGSVAHEGYYYLNPNIKIQEMMAQRTAGKAE